LKESVKLICFTAISCRPCGANNVSCRLLGDGANWIKEQCMVQT